MVITHDLGVVAEMADEIAVMYAGRIVENAPTDTIFDAPEHPYTWGLLSSIPRLDTPRDEELVPIAGRPPSLIMLPGGCSFHPRCPYVREAHTRVEPTLESIEGDPRHRVACLLDSGTRKRLWRELRDGTVPEEAREGVMKDQAPDGVLMEDVPVSDEVVPAPRWIRRPSPPRSRRPRSAAHERHGDQRPERRGPSPGGAEPLIEVRDLVKHFPMTQGIILQRKVGAVQAVDGVSFDVLKGETLGLVGESGCGKSTTARLLMRLMDPTSGSIRFEGQEISGLKGQRLKQLRQDMQMIFQDPYSSLNPRKTVGTIIGEPFSIQGMHSGEGERKRTVQELMDMVGLNPEHYNRYPHEFSGGQRQRIGVARALALKPKLIVADEPVSALDVSIQAQILNLLRELQRDIGITLVFIAHDLSVVRHMCDRVAVMYLGRIVEMASSEELYAHPRMPYTGALMSAVPVADPRLAAQKKRQVLAGDVPSPTNPPQACRFHTRCWKAQEICRTDDPPLEVKDGGNVAACHFPLTDAEVADRIPSVRIKRG